MKGGLELCIQIAMYINARDKRTRETLARRHVTFRFLSLIQSTLVFADTRSWDRELVSSIERVRKNGRLFNSVKRLPKITIGYLAAVRISRVSVLNSEVSARQELTVLRALRKKS